MSEDNDQTLEQQQQLHKQQQQQYLMNFWQQQINEIERLTPDDFKDCKNHQLPLARIKKIMKCDEDVRMISAEAPVLFAKACELFILDLTLRSWIHTDENRRRTLQRSDIACAITKTDIFDFLIDIVPRDEKAKTKQEEQPRLTGITPEQQMQFYLMTQQQLAQQHMQSMQQAGMAAAPPVQAIPQAQPAGAEAMVARSHMVSPMMFYPQVPFSTAPQPMALHKQWAQTQLPLAQPSQQQQHWGEAEHKDKADADAVSGDVAGLPVADHSQQQG